MRPKVLAFFTTLCFLAGTVWVFLAVMRTTGGHFTYSLDDPYIHLALSERLAHGLYGLNAGESASSSSSLIWPFLFVPFVGTRIFQFMPLALNLIVGGATAWLIGYLIATLDAFQPRPVSRWRAPLIAVLLLFATNLFGLAFTGMEHSLQVLLCVCCAYAILQLQWDRRISPILLFAVALLPSVRYEGILPMLAVACALWAAHRKGKALALVACSLAPLLLFALFLHHLHLPPLPMSVLIKGATGATGSTAASAATSATGVVAAKGITGATAATGAFGAFVHHVASSLLARARTTIHETERHVEFFLFLALAALTYRFRKSRQTLIALGAVTLSAAAQVVAGPNGWFYRYEMYSISFAAPIVIAGFLHTPALFPRKTPSHHGIASDRPQIPGLLLLAVAGAAAYYAVPFYATSTAASSIYHQQAQMARFATEYYKGPVAINDLGLVAMHRDASQYVLDLVGLGSYEVFQVRRKDHTSAWMESLAAEHGIGLVMMYPDWFGTWPASWHPVGRLCVPNLKYGAAKRNVVFYATPRTDIDLLRTQITQFKQTLPSGSTMDLIDDTSALTCPN